MPDKKRLTDRQVAIAYLVNRLWGLCPDDDTVRYYAEAKLTPERCARVRDELTKLCAKVREPLLRQLAAAGVEGT